MADGVSIRLHAKMARQVGLPNVGRSASVVVVPFAAVAAARELGSEAVQTMDETLEMAMAPVAFDVVNEASSDATRNAKRTKAPIVVTIAETFRVESRKVSARNGENGLVSGRRSIAALRANVRRPPSPLSASNGSSLAACGLPSRSSTTNGISHRKAVGSSSTTPP